MENKNTNILIIKYTNQGSQYRTGTSCSRKYIVLAIKLVLVLSWWQISPFTIDALSLEHYTPKCWCLASIRVENHHRRGHLFDHPPWRRSRACEGPVRGPLSLSEWCKCAHVMCGMVCMGFQVLFLLVEEGSSTFGIMAGIWAKFYGITKGKWSCHQSLGFSKVWLVSCF